MSIQDEAYITIPDYADTAIQIPKYDWRCELFGCGDQFILMRAEGHQPNAFWRITQYLVFGNKWSRVSSHD